MDKLFSDLDSLSLMSLEKAEKNLREIRTYIENDFQGIARLMEAYHPLEILRRSLWTVYDNEHKKKDEFTLAYYRLIPVLLQSVLVSTHYKKENFNRNRMVKSRDYDRILALCLDVHRRLLRLIDCKTAIELNKGTVVKADAERYRTNLFKLFYPPKENSERIESIYYVFDAYATGEDKKIEEHFGVKGQELSKGLKDIADKSLTAIENLSIEIKAFRAEVELLVAQRREDSRYKTMSEEDLTKLIIRENKWKVRSQTLASSRDDFDLFRPEFFSSLPLSAYSAVSAEPGTLDLYSYLEKGLWPASLKPFVTFGAFTFTFLGSHAISYGNRMLLESLGTNDVPSRTAQYALSLLFNPTDVVDVYSFDGNKIDLFVLPTMLEVNPYLYPERFSRRLHDKNEEKNRKAKAGHSLLIVDPDVLDNEIKPLGENAFYTSAACLLRAIRTKEGIRDVHHTIFGTIEYPEGVQEYDEALLDSELDSSEPLEDELLDDYTSDEYEYAEDEELLEKKISEKEAKLEEEPEDLEAKDRTEELKRLKNIYELTPEIVKKEEEEEKEREPFENELDEVEYQNEEDYSDVDDVESEDEELYDEVEKEDVYQEDEPEAEPEANEDPSQLNFLDLLDDDYPEEKELTNELIEDDEKSFEKDEEKAEALDKEYSDYVDADEYEDLEAEDGEAPEETKTSETSEPQTTVEPVSDEEPVTEEPVTEEPVTEEPVADEPVAEEPVADEPVADEPVVDEPVVDEKASVAKWISFFNDYSPNEDDSTEPTEEPAEEPAAQEKDLLDGTPNEEHPHLTPADEELIEEGFRREGNGLYVMTGSSNYDFFPPTESIDEEADQASEEYAEEEPSDEEIEEILREDSIEEEKKLSPEDMIEEIEIPELEEDENEKLLAELTGALSDIVKTLGCYDGKFVSFLKNSDKDMLNYLNTIIESSWKKQQVDHKDKLFSIYDYSISVLLADSPVRDELRLSELLNNAGAVMYSKDASEWTALILYINEEYKVEEASETTFNRESFSSSDWKRIVNIGEILKSRSKK